MDAKIGVAQSLKRLFKISEAPAGAVRQDAYCTDDAQVPSLGFEAGIPFVYQQ